MREEFTRLGFFKKYLLPALLILALPAFSALFFVFAAGQLDARVINEVRRMITADPRLTDAKRTEIRTFFERHPPSEILSSDDPDLVPAQKMFEGSLANDYAMFRWSYRLAWGCLVSALGVLLVGGIAVALSFRSQRFQFWTLAMAWHVLRIVAVAQVVAQGILAVVLSYWVTVVLFHHYVLKLILIVAICVLAAIAAVMKAMFTRVDDDFELEGEILTLERGAHLWRRVASHAVRLGIEKPDQIVVGIDDNFFVTEHEVIVRGQRYKGRTLYLSLPLLKILAREEADAVLCHELAHFSGQDTTYSKRTAPILIRYGEYLAALHEQRVARPVFYFMLGFRSMFELSIRRTSRSRELRADALAAEMTSPKHVAGALVKIGAYSQYRSKVVMDRFRDDAQGGAPRLKAGIAEGFPRFIADGLSLEELGESVTVHPFDSHPPLEERLAAVGAPLDPEQRAVLVVAEPGDTWHAAIDEAEALEDTLWDEYEKMFTTAHERSLAVRYLPSTPEETEIVARHFPPQTLEMRKGAPLVMDHASFTLAGNPSVAFHDITGCTRDDNRLNVKYRTDDGEGVVCVNMAALQCGPEQFMGIFGRYWGRAEAAREYQAAREEEAAGTASDG